MSNIWSSLYAQVKHDLLPTQQRVDLSWRIALVCALMVGVAMIYKIPFVAVSCFVIFFVMRSDSAESNVLAIALIILASIVVALLLLLIDIALPSPAVRLGLILVSSYILLFFGASTQLGPLGGIIALVITFVLSILNYVEVPEIAVRGTLYAWLMAATPMGIVLLANWLWGRRPKNVLLFELQQRLLACQRVLDNELLSQSAPTPTPTISKEAALSQLRDFVVLGMDEQQKRIGWLKAFRLVPKKQVHWAEHTTLNVYALMLAVLNWDRAGYLHDPNMQAINRQLAQACGAAAQAVRKGQSVEKNSIFEPLVAWADFGAQNGTYQFLQQNEISTTLAAQMGAEEGQKGCMQQRAILAELAGSLLALTPVEHYSHLTPEKEPFAQADIWRNPQYKHHAIKGTAAATICYMLYSIADWQGIHTAMITCYVAALGSTAETLHKLTLRIIGCLIGAALGMLTLFFLMVHINDIGSLLVVVFLVSWLSAWVFTGPERISYAGIQIAFAFYLVLLHSFGPSFDFGAAWDRIVGVLLGNVMMYVFFTRLWPVGQQPFTESSLEQAQQLLDRLHSDEALSRDEKIQLAARCAVKLEAARNSLQLMLFELKNIRPKPAAKKKLERRLGQLRHQLEQSIILPAGSIH